jgi:glycosyltransferase involved in cell wall biosynthesis
MRIALVQDHLRMGGSERQTVILANAFVAAGHDVLLLTFRPGGALNDMVSSAVTRIVLQSFDMRADWFAPGLTNKLRDFAPDIVQLMGRMANCHGWRIAKALPALPIVATFRTGKPVPKLYQQTLNRAAAVVFNSTEAAARIAVKHSISGSKVSVIRNAVTDSSLPPSGARVSIRSEIGTPPDAIVFIRTAMMRPEKAHAKLLRIMAGMNLNLPWELWMVGDGPEMASCVALAEQLQLNGRVRFLGLRRDVPELNAAADIAVLVSDSESLPNCLVEAQWAGLPVAARQTGGVFESFVHNESGLLTPPNSDETFKAALCRLATDHEMRTRMSKAARVFARREFDPDTQNRRYLELYAQLIEAQKNRPSDPD